MIFQIKPFLQNVYAEIFISSIFQVSFSLKSVSEHEGEKKTGIGYKRRFALFQWCRQNSSFILGLAMFVASKYAKTRYCYKITPSYLLLVSTRERFLYKRKLRDKQTLTNKSSALSVSIQADSTHVHHKVLNRKFANLELEEFVHGTTAN